MRIDCKDYSKAKKCLKRYTYNCLNILLIRTDIMQISGVNYDGMPKAVNKISDIVSNSVIQLEEDEELNRSVKEWKAVRKAIEIINRDSKYIFEHLYEKKDMNKWDIVNSGMSEGTFKRRHSELVYAVHNELKKMRQN